MRFSGRTAGSRRALARSTPSCAPFCAYDRVRVAASSNSTAAGSSNNATTRMTHRRTVSLSAPMSVARYRTGTQVGLDGAALVIRLLKRRPLREGRLCGRPRPERPS
jgi:hypothetical protein